MINIYIGYDTREIITYHVCSNSIINTSSEAVNITPLALANLKNCYTETHTDGSTEFTYTRFLVPFLQNYKGWAIFIDGDMILKDDIIKLWNLRDESKAAMVVKHDYSTATYTKFLGQPNVNYPCKNWSSVVLWNCGHPKNKLLVPEFIQQATGSTLHQFTWLNSEDIGELPLEWNWLADEMGPNTNAKLIHYTLGSPCFENFAKTSMADDWYSEFFKLISAKRG